VTHDDVVAAAASRLVRMKDGRVLTAEETVNTATVPA
jgi:hypothetical protein